MVKMILVFLVVFATIYGGIALVRSMSNLEKWQLTKTASYATIVSVVTTLLLSTIVFLF